MNYKIISDTHFFHKAIIEFCDRPLNHEQLMFDSMMQIAPDDVLLHLGDICMGKDEYIHETYIKPLKCRKWLIKGNHDHKSNTWYLHHGWDFVADVVKDKMFGKKILFSHVPQYWDGWYEVNIHGHFHNTDHRRNEPELNRCMNHMHRLYAPEYENYHVVNLEKFLNRFRK